MKFALYLHMDGRAEELMDHYIEVFDGEELFRMHYTQEVTEDENLLGKIFHAEMILGEFRIYVTDSKGKVDNIYNLVFETESLEQAKDVLHKLSKGGTLNRDMTLMSYGPMIGSVVDRFGVEWDIVVDRVHL